MILLTTELLVLVMFAVVAIVKSFNGVTKTVTDSEGVETVYRSMEPSWSWLSPARVPTSAIGAGLVVAVFAYWGWDTCVSVNEETKDCSRTPGLAAYGAVLIGLLPLFGGVVLIFVFIKTVIDAG